MNQFPHIEACPFCGVVGGFRDHGYSDEYLSVGCKNLDCDVHPSASVRVRSYPHDETKTTFWMDITTAQHEAVAIWNRRTPSDDMGRVT